MTAQFSTTDLAANDVPALLANYEVFGDRREAQLGQAFVHYLAAYGSAQRGDLRVATDHLRHVAAFAVEHGEARPLSMAFDLADHCGITREAIQQAPERALTIEAPHIPFAPAGQA